MPIYAYRCADCGFSRDVLQKLSDKPLSVCPSCGKENFKKQLTAASFQLKGTGWYQTDFKDNHSDSHSDAGTSGCSCCPMAKPDGSSCG